MSCLYENNSDAILVFDHLIGTIAISRQFKYDYQEPFFDHINCMIEKNHAYMETDNISKLLRLVVTINPSSLELMKTSIEHLTKTLKKKQLSRSSQR